MVIGVKELNRDCSGQSRTPRKAQVGHSSQTSRRRSRRRRKQAAEKPVQVAEIDREQGFASLNEANGTVSNEVGKGSAAVIFGHSSGLGDLRPAVTSVSPVELSIGLAGFSRAQSARREPLTSAQVSGGKRRVERKGSPGHRKQLKLGKDHAGAKDGSGGLVGVRSVSRGSAALLPRAGTVSRSNPDQFAPEAELDEQAV
jgi:hypothetical protein